MTVSDHASTLDSPMPRGVPIADTPVADLPAGARTAGGDFAVLRQMVRDRGLYEPQPAYLAMKLVVSLGMLAVSTAILFLFDQVWIQVLNAALLAIAFTQLGLVGHDVGHRQTLRRGWMNDVLGLIVGNLLIGVSRDWWVGKHNMHHSHPNEEDEDPDLAIPLLAFSERQALASTGVTRFIMRYQAYFLLPLMTLQAIGLRDESVRHLRKGKAKHQVAEVVLLIAHFCWYLPLVFWTLGAGLGLLFIVVHQVLFGLYMSSIFAPNHKGMPIWEKTEPPDFLRQQVITARNVYGGVFNDWWYGGLNYQIEHHLFPTMPRNKLSTVQPIVKEYCAARDIPYHETGAWQSFREIWGNFHEISAVLRQPKM